MADITATVIAAIHAKINSQISPDELPYKIGKKYIHANDSPPRVVWVEADTSLEPAKRAGGNPAEIGIDLARFDVHIWHDSLENARISMHNIIAAARQVYDGPSIRFASYDRMEDASGALTPKGEGMILHAEMRIKIPEFVKPTVQVTAFDGDAIAELPAGDEVVGSTAIPP